MKIFQNISKKSYIILLIIFLLIFSIFSYFFINWKWSLKDWINNSIVGDFVDSFSPMPLDVVGWNFDLNYKKLPIWEDYVDFVFNYDIDSSLVNTWNVILSPSIPWELSVKWKNTVRFTFSSERKIGDNIEFTFLKNIKSLDWISPIEDINFLIESVWEVKVVKVNPEWVLNNLNQNFAVFFNMPIVPLTDLDSRDTLPCPIEFTPTVKWTCKWTTTSVLEFIPEEPLHWATDYKVSVLDKPWLLYSIWEAKTVDVKTPDLNVYLNNSFQVSEWIPLRFNFPVSREELKSKLHLSSNNIEKNILITNKEWSETIYYVKMENESYDYWWVYSLSIDSWLKSKYWNRAMNRSVRLNISSNNFLSSVNIYRNIYSETWALIDTRSEYYSNWWINKSLLPVKDLFFVLDFDEEVELNDRFYVFRDEDWNDIPTKSSYMLVEEVDNITKEKTVTQNKNKIKLELVWDLKNDRKYDLIVLKEINDNLKNDEIKSYQTSKELVINEFLNVSYRKSCLYFSNPIEYNYFKSDEIIEITPDARIDWIWRGDYIPDNIQYLSRDNIISRWYCPRPKDNEYLYVISTRLNPLSEYELKVKYWIDDVKWNVLKEWVSKKITTWRIKPEDTSLYIWAYNKVNIYPDDKNLVVNIQWINLDKAIIEVCEMDENMHMNYMKHQYTTGYVQECISKVQKEIWVNNYNWNISNNKIDIEEDILDRKFKERFILIKWFRWNNLAFSTSFIRQSLSLTLEKASNKDLLFIADYLWNQIKDVDITLYSFDSNTKKIIKEDDNVFELNSDTWVYENNIENQSYNYLLVQDNKWRFWFIDTNMDWLSDYDFKYISWEQTSEKDYLYLYTDRPIYRPWDTVHLKWLLRRFTPNWYTKSDIEKAKIEIVDSSYSKIASIDVDVDSNSNLSWEFIIPEKVSLWKFTFRFTIIWNNNYTVRNNAFFHIEEYVKPTFKVWLSEDKSDYLLWDSLNISVSPEYYFGWKMINTSWRVNLLTQNYFFDAKDYSYYQFWEWYRYFDCIYWWYCINEDSLSFSDEIKIDSNWLYKFNYKFPSEDKYSEKIYNFTFDVVDPDTSKVVSANISKILHSTDAYVWIKSNYYNSKKAWIDLWGVVLDFDAKPLKDKKVKIDLIKTDWKMVKKKWVDWIFYSEYDVEEKLEKTMFVNSDNKWEFSKNIQTDKSWEYKIVASYTWKNSKSFISSKRVYVAWEDYIVWWNDNNDITEFVSEKMQVKVWETAHYMLKSPVNNWKALLLIEKDDAILDYFIHDISSYSDKIDIKVKDNYYPNYYLRAFLIWTEKDNPLPIYKRALIVTKVDTGYKNLKVEVKPEKERYLPWDKVKTEILVLDSEGNPVPNANWSISIVDQSLLALKWNPKKNPYAFFYDMKRYLWTTMFTSLKNLVEKLEVKDSSNWEKWGAWDVVKWWDSKKKRWNFKDTAFWQADFTTNSNWIAIVESIQLPDNLTTWVIETLVNTSDDTKLWIDYSTIVTSKSLIINENLPRYFWSNDNVVLSPVVFNKTWKDWYFDVSLSATNTEIIWDDSKKIFILDGDSKTVNFELKVNDIWISKEPWYFTSKINIKVNSKDSGNYDEVEKILKINEVSTPEYVSTFWKTTTESYEEILELWKVKKSKWNLVINYWATLFTSLLDSIDFLNRYPYWCAEQITSALMPNIFIKRLYDSAWSDFDLSKKMVKYWSTNDTWYLEKSVDQLIKEYLVNIKSFQKSDWWFKYWWDSTYEKYSDFELTYYLLESASYIKELWYEIDEKVYFDSINYLKNRFYLNKREWCHIDLISDCKYGEINRMRAISAIINYNKTDYEAYKMYKLLDQAEFKSVSVKLEHARLISNLLKINSISWSEKVDLKKIAKEIINEVLSNQLVFNPKWAYIWKDAYYSRIKNTSLFLETISSLWLEEFDEVDLIIDNINRWMISQKSNWSFGSTLDNINVIRSITSYLESSKELSWVNYLAKLKLNTETVDEKRFDNENKFDTYSKFISVDVLKDTNSFVAQKEWKWNLYFDLNLSYFKNAEDIFSRDEWFYIEKAYYKYEDYKKILSLKDAEYKKYLSWEIEYWELEYPKEVFEYINEKDSWKVGELYIVNNKLITNEVRDKVSFEWFIPAWSELINPTLETTWSDKISNLWFFEKEEYRDDRYFAYKLYLYPWIYNFNYLIRLTHAWEYSVKPSYVSEFYNQEVFWRTSGQKFIIE